MCCFTPDGGKIVWSQNNDSEFWHRKIKFGIEKENIGTEKSSTEK